MAAWILILIIVGLALLIGGSRYCARMLGRHHGIPDDGRLRPIALVPDRQQVLIDAVSSVYRGDVYFFCSTEDRDAFEATQGASIGHGVPSGRSAGAMVAKSIPR